MTGTVNELFGLRDSGCSNSDESVNLPRHRWYTVKEGFSPRLVEYAINDAGLRPDHLVLDPFCGSGTTPLTACLQSRQAAGVEVNPFLAFVAETKLLQANHRRVARGAEIIAEGIREGEVSDLERFSTFSRRGGAKKWLFNLPVLRGFEGGWERTSRFSRPVRQLLRLSLLGAALDACNATRDGKCLRYRQSWNSPKLGRRDLLNAFRKRVGIVCSDLETAPLPQETGPIIKGDSRVLVRRAAPDGFRLCVTSPPYLNSFDYSDVYRPELFLGKFVRSNEELMTIRLQTIRSHVQASWEPPRSMAFGGLFKDCLMELEERRHVLWDRRIPMMVQAYFEDMSRLLLALRQITHKDGALWFVVSTSAYAGVEIPVDLILAEIGARAGWFLREVGVLRYLRVAGQHWNRQTDKRAPPQLRESAVIFDATPRRGGRCAKRRRASTA